MYRFLFAVVMPLVVLYIFCGCTTPVYPQYLTDEVKTSVKNVSISKEVRFPDTLKVLLPNNSSQQAGMIGAMIVGGILSGMEERYSKDLNDQVKSRVDVNKFISEEICEGFADVLRTNISFNLVETNRPADAEFVFVVDWYGLKESSDFFSSRWQVAIDTSLMLIGNPPYLLTRKKERQYRLEPEDITNNPVLWQRQVSGRGPRRSGGIFNFMNASVTNDFHEAITNLNAYLSGALNERPKKKK